MQNETGHSQAPFGFSRRRFLWSSASTGALIAATSRGLQSPFARAADRLPRQQAALDLRVAAAEAQIDQIVPQQETNGDEALYSDRRASFTKTLPHNAVGEVDTSAYNDFLDILASGESSRFEAISRADEGDRKLANPQAAYAFELCGADAHASRMVPPPAFASAAMAADMGEVYWRALLRDVPYREYESHDLVAAAVADLNAFSVFSNPQGTGQTTVQSLFRGETAGDASGPSISQFLWRDIPYGIGRIEQRYRFPEHGQDFMTEFADWLAIQRGVDPSRSPIWRDSPRYISNARDLAEFVHQDFTYQSYLNAALIAMEFGSEAMPDHNPYRQTTTQSGFVTFGNSETLHLLAQAANVALKAAWYQKWLVHRRLRPEVFAARIERRLQGGRYYDIHPDILDSEAVERLRHAQASALLPLAYAEGSPTHPSYPAGHAAVAGACTTVLKACFREDFPIPHPVQASADGATLEPWQGSSLTLGGEFEKLASNITHGRDAAGVHYRSDGIEGMKLGEAQAIALLCDYSRTYCEEFDGYVFTAFDGHRIRIADGIATEEA